MGIVAKFDAQSKLIAMAWLGGGGGWPRLKWEDKGHKKVTCWSGRGIEQLDEIMRMIEEVATSR